jgi:hypothetical protein
MGIEMNAFPGAGSGLMQLMKAMDFNHGKGLKENQISAKKNRLFVVMNH